MNATQLLARFNLIADQPASIPLLRRLIVDLAVRGQLLPSDEFDITPEEMLERISARSAAISTPEALKKTKPLPKIDDSEIPARYLEHCTFERLGSIANLRKGLTGIQSAVAGKFPLVVTASDRTTCDHFDFEGAAAIIPLVSSTGHGSATINRLHFQEGKFALGTILCAVFPIDEQLISARFLFEYLTVFKEELLVSKMLGTANVTLTLGKIAEVPVPIIAPSAQRRVDELMALCDQLEAAQQERERRRDRLAAASLQRLNQPAPDTTPEAQREHARFHLHHLPRLTTRPAHIKAMRQAILNAAVRGKLSEIDPKDQPSAELLNDVIAARDALLAQRKTQREVDVERSISMDEAHVPEHWVFVHVSDFALIQGGKRLPAGVSFSKEPTPYIYIRVTDMKEGTVRTDDLQFISQQVQATISQYTISKHDLYITIAGTIGQVGRIPDELDGQNLTENAAKIVFRGLNLDYISLCLRSDAVQLQFQEKTKQTAQPKLALKRVAGASIPIPPLAEQHRIVARVDELMALCDQLEAQLTTTQTNSRRLLEAVLEAALALRK